MEGGKSKALKPHNKQKQLRQQPSGSQKVLVCSWHFLCVCIYAAIHWYEYKLLSECPNVERYFPGSDSFGGRWKYLTAITMNLMLVYFCVALLNDLLTNFHSFISWFFTTVIWPLAWVVFIFFWTLYAIDRELIFPKFFDNYFPVLINVCWHAVLFPVVILEVLIVQHRYPSHLSAVLMQLGIGAAYTAWTIVLHSKTGRWTYPFMSNFDYLGFCIFSLMSSLIAALFYFIGRALAAVRWGQ